MHAGVLAQAGLCVSVLDYRPQRAAKLTQTGIHLCGAVGDFTAHLPVTADTSQLRPVDLAIFFVKAHSTAQALQHARGVLGPNTVLLTLQNGLGNYELLLQAATSERVLAGTSSSGAYRTADNEVHIAAVGDIQIGAAGGESWLAAEVSTLFSQAGLPAEACTQMHKILWRKAIINAGINPVAALAAVTNGELLTDPRLHKMLRGLVSEAVQVAAVHGISFDEDLVAVTEKVCEHTGQNRCSMLQDLDSGRMTEIEQINGHIAAVGRQHGMAAHLNETITRQIRAAQQEYERNTER